MKYKRLITVERPTTVLGGEFGPAPGPWEPLEVLPGSPAVAEKFWAEVEDVMPSRSEAVRQGLAQARNQTRIRFRWRDDVDSSMRIIVHGDTDVVYSIIGGPAEIAGRKRRIEVMCERYATAGGT